MPNAPSTRVRAWQRPFSHAAPQSRSRARAQPPRRTAARGGAPVRREGVHGNHHAGHRRSGRDAFRQSVLSLPQQAGIAQGGDHPRPRRPERARISAAITGVTDPERRRRLLVRTHFLQPCSKGIARRRCCSTRPGRWMSANGPRLPRRSTATRLPGRRRWKNWPAQGEIWLGSAATSPFPVRHAQLVRPLVSAGRAAHGRSAGRQRRRATARVNEKCVLSKRLLGFPGPASGR